MPITERRSVDEEDENEGSDDDFDPTCKKPKSKGKQKQKEPPLSATAEHGRALHTLEEHHNHLLTAAFDGSLTGSVQGGPGFAASSSQVDGGFGFDDNLFALPDGMGGADIGDELAQELGEGWGGSASRAANEYVEDYCGGGILLTFTFSCVRARIGQDAGFDLDVDQGLGDDFRFDVNQEVDMQPADAVADRGALVMLRLLPLPCLGLTPLQRAFRLRVP